MANVKEPSSVTDLHHALPTKPLQIPPGAMTWFARPSLYSSSWKITYPHSRPIGMHSEHVSSSRRDTTPSTPRAWVREILTISWPCSTCRISGQGKRSAVGWTVGTEGCRNNITLPGRRWGYPKMNQGVRFQSTRAYDLRGGQRRNFSRSRVPVVGGELGDIRGRIFFKRSRVGRI